MAVEKKKAVEGKKGVEKHECLGGIGVGSSLWDPLVAFRQGEVGHRAIHVVFLNLDFPPAVSPAPLYPSCLILCPVSFLINFSCSLEGQHVGHDF